MKKFYFILTVSLILTGCFSTKSNHDNKQALVQIVTLKDLELNILKIGEKREKYNDINIDFEITNNSEYDFMNKESYVIYFNVITKSGKELIDYKKFYNKLPKKKTILLNHKLDLSTYQKSKSFFIKVYLNIYEFVKTPSI